MHPHTQGGILFVTPPCPKLEGCQMHIVLSVDKGPKSCDKHATYTYVPPPPKQPALAQQDSDADVNVPFVIDATATVTADVTETCIEKEIESRAPSEDCLQGDADTRTPDTALEITDATSASCHLLVCDEQAGEPSDGDATRFADSDGVEASAHAACETSANGSVLDSSQESCLNLSPQSALNGESPAAAIGATSQIHDDEWLAKPRPRTALDPITLSHVVPCEGSSQGGESVVLQGEGLVGFSAVVKLRGDDDVEVHVRGVCDGGVYVCMC
jgi:hypothetical protein